MQTAERTSWNKVLERGETECCEKLPRKKRILNPKRESTKEEKINGDKF